MLVKISHRHIYWIFNGPAMMHYFAAAIAVIIMFSVSSTVQAKEYLSCPEPNLGFQEYKNQLATCMSDAGHVIEQKRLDMLLEAPVKFNFGVTFDAFPASNGADRFSNSAITQEGSKHRDIGRLVASQPDSIFGIHKTLVENLKKYQLNKIASPTPYDVLKSQMLGSFAQTLPLVGQSDSSVKTETEVSKAEKAVGAAGKAEVSDQENKPEKKADAKSERVSSKQISPSAGAVATSGTSVYAIVGGLGVAVAAGGGGGGGGGGGSSCSASASIEVSLQTIANFSEAASSTITANSTAAPCRSISVSLTFSGQAISGTDFQNVTALVIPANQTVGSIELVAVDDNVYEGNETIVVDISAVDGGIDSGAQQQSFVLQDNESQPTVTLATSTTSIDEKTGTATLTAAASGAADENMVITLSGSGTATAGTDYTLPTITIAAGALTGTATFTPVDDTFYETSQAGVAEIATLDIASVTVGTESGSQSVSISITERALNSGTQISYNLINAEFRRASTEFSNFNASTAASVQNPLERINAHKAYGYGLDGSGQTIMVMDSCMNQTHPDLQNPTISAYGTVTICNGGDYHGVTVAGVIAADVDNGLLVGVAPGVSLVHAEYSNLTNTEQVDSTFAADKWAEATNYARSNNIIAQNNSWGPSDTSITALQDDITNIGISAVEAIATDWNNSFGPASDGAGSSVQSYVNALNNYQEAGVVVFALSNTDGLDDADVIAALPVLFSQLDEAWITAVNIEILGTTGLEVYQRVSAPCGQTAAYCLGADAWQIMGLAHDNNYEPSTQGTSFVSPMISGAVAILAQAFPNHTPEQLVDRLLASADNSWFTPDANTTFANGVVHGYNTEFGHGILDIYAALQPITSNSNVKSLRVYSGQSNLNQPSNSFGRTALTSSRSFGDGIKNALAGINSFVYDDMNGGFTYDLSGHIAQSEHVAKSINLSSELHSLSALNLLLKPKEQDRLFSYDFGGSKGAVKYSLTRGNASLPVQNFLNNKNMLLKNLVDYETPYLSRFEDGIGLSAYLETDQRTYFFGYNPKIADDPSHGSMLSSFDRLSVDRFYEPISDFDISSNQIGSSIASIDDPNLNALRRNGSFAFGFKQKLGDSSNIRFITGLAEEDNGFMGLSGSGAFTLDGAETSTTFTGVNFSSDISDNLSLGAVAIYANSEMFNRGHSILSGVDQAVSNSFGLNLEASNIWGSDRLEISLAQPNRIQEGSMRVRVANLADVEGNLSYRSKLVSLEPSGRQIDLSVGYAREFSKDFVFSAKLSRTSQLNHIKTAEYTTSAYIGARYKDLSIGAATSIVGDEFLVHWSHPF